MSKKRDKGLRPYCSFCGLSQEAVVMLIAGNWPRKAVPYICSDCIAQCVAIVAQRKAAPEQERVS